jgi:hypothetical protein
VTLSRRWLAAALLLGLAPACGGYPEVVYSSDAGGPGGDASAETAGGGTCGLVEAEPNDSRDRATPYSAGAAVTACLGTPEDVDFYELTAPAADLAGGYYTAAVSDVGDGRVEVKVYTASDNANLLDNAYTTERGASLSFFWAAAPGQKYRISVARFQVADAPFKYTFKADYTKVSDAFEPNDTRDQARPIALGTPVSAALFAGHKGQEVAATAFEDWYQATLASGKLTVKLENVPTDVRAEVRLVDPAGQPLDPRAQSLDAGAGLTLTRDALPAGTYKVVVAIYAVAPLTAGRGMTVPDSYTRSYKLTVTQP